MDEPSPDEIIVSSVHVGEWSGKVCSRNFTGSGMGKKDFPRANCVRVFKNISTIGVRETVTQRYVLERRIETVQTPYGEVRCNVFSGRGNIFKLKSNHTVIYSIKKEKNQCVQRPHIKRRIFILAEH